MGSRRPRVVTVERFIPASAEAVFDVVVSPERHPALDGAEMVSGAASGPARLHAGARFTMTMRQGPVRYRSVNQVTDFEQDRVIAWRTTGEWRGRTVVGGQWWRYELLPEAGGTLVRHSYEWGRARFAPVTVGLAGYPRRMARTMPGSLQRLEDLVLAPG